MLSSYEEEEVSDEEKLKIAKTLLLQSPPGQFFEVLKDVRQLVPSHVLTEERVKDIAYIYNTSSCVPARVHGDRRILISKDTQINDRNHFMDTHDKKVYAYDHVKQKVVDEDGRGGGGGVPTSSSSVSDSSQTEPIRHEACSVLRKALDAYSRKKYPNQCDSAVIDDPNTGALVLLLCAENVNLRNFWSGRWKSRWEIHGDMSNSPVRLSGIIDVHIHYFENGNLQLQTKKNEECQVEFSDLANFAQAIVDAIRKAEDSIQSNLEDMYTNMSQETFKEMRRVTPITQTKMDWNINQHRALGSLLQRSST